jgi:hypothetical protein
MGVTVPNRNLVPSPSFTHFCGQNFAENFFNGASGLSCSELSHLYPFPSGTAQNFRAWMALLRFYCPTPSAKHFTLSLVPAHPVCSFDASVTGHQVPEIGWFDASTIPWAQACSLLVSWQRLPTAQIGHGWSRWNARNSVHPAPAKSVWRTKFLMQEKWLKCLEKSWKMFRRFSYKTTKWVEVRSSMPFRGVSH